MEETKKDSTLSLVERAEAAAKAISAANETQAKLLEQQERLKARDLLGGTTIAGQEPAKPVEETPQQYAKRILQGAV